jgi:hypothetical protein
VTTLRTEFLFGPFVSLLLVPPKQVFSKTIDARDLQGEIDVGN